MNKALIKQKQIEYLYDNLDSAMSAVAVLSLVLFVLFDGLVDKVNLRIWTVFSLSFVTLRVALLLWYKKHPINVDNSQKYYILYSLGLLGTSLVLGSSVFFIFPKEVEFQVLLLLVLGGLSAGAAVTTTSRIELFNIYLIFTLIPFVYAFIAKADTLNYSLAAFATLFVLILFVISRKISITVNNNIVLALEKEHLVRQLEAKVDKATCSNEAKSRFLSTMSHEIRTPMNVIIGFIKILQKMEKEETKLKYINIIDSSSNLLLNILNDILDVNKIESGKLRIEVVSFNVKEEVETLFELYEASCKQKGVILINGIDLDDNLVIQSDKHRLKQIITNLLSNALKFTPAGKKVELHVAYKKEESLLFVEVKDEGIGVAKEDISRILEEFSQADSSTARKYGGTGLGLTIVSKLLELLDSSLTVDSKEGLGSSFSFNLKVTEDSLVKKEYVEKEKVDFSHKKILVVEDNKTNQMLIEILLREKNLDICMANDGLQALEYVKKEKFELILMDINMPNMNGIEAMKAIKANDKNLEKIPIIALTANAVSGDKDFYIKEGFDAYLAKPIDDTLLQDCLEKYL